MATIFAWVSGLVFAVVGASAIADEYTEAVERFRAAGATEMINDAHGYAIFPTIGKGGIGIGGAYGEGAVFSGGEMIGETNVKQLTIGFQLGGQAYSQLVLFEDERALDEFTSGNFEFGAQATAVVLTAAVGAEANTGGGTSANVSGGKNDASVHNTEYRKGMAVFTIAKGGLMYEATIGGQKFGFSPVD